MQHIISEDQKKHYHVVNKIIEKIKNDGGLDSTSFHELRRNLTTRKRESGHPIIDENGIRHDSIEEIKQEHVKYYTKLLSGEDEADETSAVDRVMSGMKLLAENTEKIKIKQEEVSKVVSKLKKRKASDRQGWRNELAIYGGEEMEKSITKILQIATDQLEGPAQWNTISIKSTHKKGSKMLMPNKRGLFLTNIISKILERVIKERNRKPFSKGLSPAQTGGQPKVSTIDNTFVILAIIERNKYLNKTTYLTFADVQKCFDKLRLDDGIKDLWHCGVHVRDAVMIHSMNREARITINTPVGITEEFEVRNIVKQGTVYAVDICAAVMDHINKTGYGIKTMYGPDLEIGALAFVDDIVSAGTSSVSDNTIQACSMMEIKKKITFNTEAGKSAVMKSHKKKVQ